VGAGTWYPVNDEPTDKASYRIAVTVDKPYTAVANGVPVSVTDLGARRRFLWEQAQPMASYLAITDIDEYLLDQRQAANGVVIRTYYTADTPAASLEALRQTPAMMAYFEELVGRYPFDGYGAVIVRDPELFYALETQAMSTFQKDNIDEATVVHELAHQWFGDAVTVAEWRDLWLAEGFATYAEFQWEHRADRPGLEAAMRDLYAYVAENQVGPAVVSRPQDLFADNTYYRGALALHALRLDVGDGDFLKTVRAFYRTYRDKNATSADFIATAVRATGKPSVRRLLRAWLYDEPVPPLPGAEAAVARLAARWPLGLASSSNREVIERVMETSGWGSVFATWVSSEEVARGKPAPDVFLEAARRLGVAPADAGGVEDSHNGILAARAAGLHVVAIPNHEFPPGAEALAAADVVLGSLDELVPEAFER
jgi:HAD superfamily hydrolase (TIGR01509 family)